MSTNSCDKTYCYTIPPLILEEKTAQIIETGTDNIILTGLDVIASSNIMFSILLGFGIV